MLKHRLVELRVLTLLQSFFVLGILPAFWTMSAYANDYVAEYDLKAVFLYNFARYSEKEPPLLDPPPQEGLFTFCLWKKDPFGEMTEEIAKRKVQGQEIAIKVISTSDEIAHCKVLFIGKSFSDDYDTILEPARNAHALTVTELPETGVISFIRTKNEIKFDCNLIEAQSSGIKLSSQLLPLCRTVTKP